MGVFWYTFSTMKHAHILLPILFLGVGVVAGASLQQTWADEAGGAAFFRDVEHDAYYDLPAAVMARRGIVKGYDDGRFAPNDPVTRGQVVTMLHRYDQSVVEPLRKQIAKLRDMMDLGRCGDGNVQVGEQCDDGNVNSGDGCSTECIKEWKPIAIPPPVIPIPHPIACPEDAKQCPDGSFVGRSHDRNCEFDPCPTDTDACKEKEQELANFIRSKRACRTDDDCSVLVRGCSPFLTCGKPVNNASLGDVKVAIAEFIKGCPAEGGPSVCALCEPREALCHQGFCRLDPPDHPECGNDICEKGEETECPCDDVPEDEQVRCMAPCREGTCPQDCVEPQKQCGTYLRDAEKNEYCAICGDGRCEPYEHCLSSDCMDGTCTDDCGPLYCPEDCE